MKDEKKFKNWLYWLTLAIAIILVYRLLENIEPIGIIISNFIGILMPFIIGMLIAYILYSPCKKIEECFSRTKYKFLKRRAKGLSVFTIYLIVGIIIFILINVIMPPIMASVKDLISNLPNYYSTLLKFLNDLPEEYSFLKDNLEDSINKIASIDFANYLSIENLMNYIKGVMSIASGIFDVFVTIVISIYTLLERRKILIFIKKIISKMFKEKDYSKISKYFKETNKVFFGFISGQVIDAIVVGIVTTIAMAILKVKYAALLGFMIGLFNMIPFFGAIVAVVISAIITICTGGIGKAIWLIIVVTILQQIDANIINPKIIGDKLSISPILIILSVTVAGAYFGLLGMFLAVPIVTMIKLMLNDYLDIISTK